MEKTIERIYDLTDEQIVELSEEQILLYIDKELAIEKIPSIALSWEYEKEPEMAYPRQGRSAIVLKDLSIGFNNGEDAQNIVNMLIKAGVFKVERQYLKGSYDTVYIGGDLISCETENHIVYTEEEIKMINKKNEENKVVDKKERNETIDKAYNIRKKVWNFVYKVRSDYEYDNKLIQIFNRYIEIADGNKEKAIEFLQEAYKFGESTDKRIRSAHGMCQDS